MSRTHNTFGHLAVVIYCGGFPSVTELMDGSHMTTLTITSFVLHMESRAIECPSLKLSSRTIDTMCVKAPGVDETVFLRE